MNDWHRLDPRMLLIGPVRVVKELAVPVIVAFIGISTTNPANLWWFIPGAVIAVVVGAVPWLTTRYRVGETQFQRRSGLLNRQQLTSPLDRVRSVDLEAPVLHRVLGLAKVRVGTGVDETRIDLDALSRREAERLRVFLLARVTAAASAPPSGLPERTDVRTPDAAQRSAALEERAPSPLPAGAEPAVLATVDWAWLRYAPFQLSRLAIAAAILGAFAQFGDDLPWLDVEHLDTAWRWVLGFAVPVVVVAAALVLLVAWLLVSFLGYVVQWWGMRLTRHHGTIGLTAGLLTTRSTTIEEQRVRGVDLVEPALMRLVGGAELAVLATGLGSRGVTDVLPPCPRPVAVDVAHTLLEAPGSDHTRPDAAPLAAPLTQHGPVARRRCHVRAQWPTVVLTGLAVVPTYLLDLGWWVPLGIGLALAAAGTVAGEAAYRSLGHSLAPAHLVARTGAVARRTTALEIDGIIGWVVRQSWLQRRVGLATVLATTAAGSEVVRVRDVPLEVGVALAAAATPEVVRPFLAGSV